MKGYLPGLSEFRRRAADLGVNVWWNLARIEARDSTKTPQADQRWLRFDSALLQACRSNASRYKIRLLITTTRNVTRVSFNPLKLPVKQ